MEHRWSTRKTIKGGVTIDCPQLGVVAGSLRDVSLGGVFIETDSVNLPIHAPVVITLTTQLLGADLCQRPLQAMVVRVTPHGAGLMFLEPDMEVIRTLRDYLYGRPSEFRQTSFTRKRVVDDSPRPGARSR